MYARRVGDKTFTFRVSGLLWEGSLVMSDVETDSQWSHILGRAMKGPSEGVELEVIPSVITTWRAWREEHPTTTVSVFSRSAQAFDKSYYQYPKQFVVGLEHSGETVCYPLEKLIETPVINDLVGGDPVVAVYDPQGSGVMIFRRSLDGQTLHFESSGGEMTAGGSRWSVATGAALDGPWNGKRLEPLPAILSYQRPWVIFHRNGRIYGDG